MATSAQSLPLLLLLFLLSLSPSHGYRYKDPVNMLKRSMHQNVSGMPPLSVRCRHPRPCILRPRHHANTLPLSACLPHPQLRTEWSDTLHSHQPLFAHHSVVQLTPSFRSKGYSTDSPFKLCVPFPFSRRLWSATTQHPQPPTIVPACELIHSDLLVPTAPQSPFTRGL